MGRFIELKATILFFRIIVGDEGFDKCKCFEVFHILEFVRHISSISLIDFIDESVGSGIAQWVKVLSMI